MKSLLSLSILETDDVLDADKSLIVLRMRFWSGSTAASLTTAAVSPTNLCATNVLYT